MITSKNNDTNKNRLMVWVALVVLGVSCPSPIIAKDLLELTPESGLPDYLSYAALNNPGLEAAFYRWKAAVEKIPQARTLSDPTFTYSYMFQDVETRVGPQEDRFALVQKFPWFGTLRLQENIAIEEAEAAAQAYEGARLALFYRVKKIYYDYYFLARSIAITEENVELLKHLESVAQAAYSAGASLGSVAQVQIELGKLEDRLRSQRDMRGAMSAAFSALLNRTHSDILPWPVAVPFEANLARTEDEVAHLLANHSPELLAMQDMLEREEQGLRLARKEGYPSFMLGVDYIVVGEAINPDTPDSGKDAAMAMVAIDLPIWRGKYKAAVREAQNRYEAAGHELDESQNTLEAQLRTALYMYRDAERKIDLYGETLVPQAFQTLNVAEEAYRSGKVDFLNLIDAQRMLLEFQLAHEHALVDREQRMAEIEMLVGSELSVEKSHENK